MSNFPSLKNEKNPCWKNVLYIGKWNFLATSLKDLQTLQNENVTFSQLFKHKRKIKKFLIVSLIKKQRIFKLKTFLKHFFSFYNISFFTQPVYFIHLLGDFCNVHDNIVAFFSFSFLRKILVSFTSFFCSLSLFSW